MEYSTEEPYETLRADNLSPMDPTLAQPSPTDDFGICNFLTETMSDGKEGGNADATSAPGQVKETGYKNVPDPAGSPETILGHM